MFSLWSAVYYYFARWQTTGLQRLNEVANRADRLAYHLLPTPSLALVDAQSIKLASRLGGQRGLDAHMRVNERKWQAVCGTGGRSWWMHVQLA